MDPTPPDPPLIRAGLIRQAAAGAVVTLVSGVVSLGVSCIRGDTHGDELKRQGKEISEIRAMLMEQQKRSE